MLCCSLQSAKTPLNVQTKVQKQEVTTKRCVCILMHQTAHPSINSAYEDAAGGNKGSFYSSGESWVLDVSISSLEDVKYLSYDMSSFTFKLIQCQRKISRKMQRKVLVKHISRLFSSNYPPDTEKSTPRSPIVNRNRSLLDKDLEIICGAAAILETSCDSLLETS